MNAIILTIFSIVLSYTVDTILIGISFQALKMRFKWNFSNRANLCILILIFLFMDVYILPMFLALDITYTVNNQAIAKFLDFKPNEQIIDLFDIGLFELFCFSIQALVASYIGEKLLVNNKKEAMAT